jgi:hypothetical protein
MAWLGSHDYITPSMNASMENAEGIVDYYLNKVTAHQGDNAGILALKNAVATKAGQFLDIRAKYSGDIGAKLAQTEDQNSIRGDMKDTLWEAFNLVIPINGKGTLGFNTIYANGTDELYNGKHLNMVAGLGGLSNLMNANGCAAAGTVISNYRTTIINRHTAQQTAIQLINDDVISEKQLVTDLSAIINQGRGYLIFNYGGTVGYEASVNMYFPLNLLQSHPTGHYQRIIPAGSFRRMCIHIFKPGEMAELIVGDKDVWVSTAADADHPQPTGYYAIAGSHVTVNPSVFGDPAKKFIIATNLDLTDSTDLIFNIIKP